jgi:thiol-disulfide isomerase/thioredoxin
MSEQGAVSFSAAFTHHPLIPHHKDPTMTARRQFLATAAAAATAACATPYASAFFSLGGGTPSVAPEFTGIETWLNSAPLRMADLRGKVVLVDFWTYTCINCLNHLPAVKSWHEKYKDKGLVTVGVHTPEFAYEKSTKNVKAAMERLGIQHAVAQDNSYATWRAFSNNYWPAVYLVDKKGMVVYSHFGEGRYAETEKTIQALLAQ